MLAARTFFLASAVTIISSACAFAKNQCVDFVSSRSKPISISDVYALAASIPEKKGEFETTEQFRTRQQDAVEKVTSQLKEKLGGPTVFVATKIDSYMWRYDADKESLSLAQYALREVPFGDPIPGPEDFDGTAGYSYNLQFERTERSPYVGTNAFGSVREVKRDDIKNYGLIVTKNSLPKKVHSVSIKLPPEEAKAIKEREDAYILLGFNMETPYSATRFWTKSPTFSDPSEWNVEDYYVIGQLQCAVIYEAATGKVLFEMK